MSEDQERLQKELREALEKLKEGERREDEAVEARVRAEEREKKAKEKAEEREKEAAEREKNLEEELKKVREKLHANESELRKLAPGKIGFLDEGNIKLEVEAEKIGEDTIFSPYTPIGGLPFRLGCKTLKENEWVEVSLHCNDSPTSKTYSAKASFTLKAFGRSDTQTQWDILPSNNSYKWNTYSTRTEALDPSKGFIKNGHFIVGAQIKVLCHYKNTFIDFATSDPLLSDVTLLVGGKRFNVNRMFLAHYSDYFKILFYSDFAEKDKKEIELEEIDVEEFEEMLGVMYPQRKKIERGTVKGLLRMGDFFGVGVVQRECIEYLKSTSDYHIIGKLKISDDFSLPELQEHLLKKLNAAKDLKNVINTGGFGNLSETLQKTLLQKHFKLC